MRSDELRPKLVKAAAARDSVLLQDVILEASQLAIDQAGIPQELLEYVYADIRRLVERYITGVDPDVSDRRSRQAQLRSKLQKAHQDCGAAMRACADLRDWFIADEINEMPRPYATLCDDASPVVPAIVADLLVSRTEATAQIDRELETLNVNLARIERLLAPLYPVRKCPSRTDAVAAISGDIHFIWRWLNLAACESGGLSHAICMNSPLVRFATLIFELLGRRAGERGIIERLRRSATDRRYKWPATGVTHVPYLLVTLGDCKQACAEITPGNIEPIPHPIRVMALERLKFLQSIVRI